MSDDLAVTRATDDTPVMMPTVGMTARRSRWWRRRWVKVAAGVLGVVLAYYLVTLYQVWSTGRSDEARRVDAIVVMGAAQYDGRPSPLLAARLDHVVELWNQGLADTVVVTGGNQPGDRFTEASASQRYLVKRGVPEGAFLAENEAHNSYDSLRTVAALLKERRKQRVLLVSDPFHSLRIRLIAEELGLTAYVSPTTTSPIGGGGQFWREVKEAAGISVGRLVSFRRLTSWTG